MAPPARAATRWPPARATRRSPSVNVSSSAPPSVTNQVSVSGGALAGASASDPTSITVPAPTASGVTFPDASGSIETFTFTASDPLGTGDLSSVWAAFNSGAAANNNCLVYFAVQSNTLTMTDDNGNWQSAVIAAGSSATLENRYCTLYGTGTSASSTSATEFRLNLKMGFKASYAGAQNVWEYVFNNAGIGSGWIESPAPFTVTTSSTAAPSLSITSSHTGTFTRSEEHTSELQSPYV